MRTIYRLALLPIHSLDPSTQDDTTLIGASGCAPLSLGGGAAGTDTSPPGLMSVDEVKNLVKDAVTEAVRAVNTPDPAARPGGSGAAPTFNRKIYAAPTIGKAMRAMIRGAWRGAEFERDISQASAELFGFRHAADGDEGSAGETHDDGWATRSSFFWPKNIGEYADVLGAMGEKGNENAVRAYEGAAVRAGLEGVSSASFTQGSVGGYLVPPEYAQDQFQYALTSPIVVRQMGIEVMPAESNIIFLPRESVAASADVAAEGGTLNPSDPTFAQQTITVKKQYTYRQYSNELLADAKPTWLSFLGRVLGRDLGLKQDLEYLTGSGAGAHITGLSGQSSTTAPAGGAAPGANGFSPTFDTFYDIIDTLRGVNVEPDFVIGHSRLLTTLSKIKDSTGNYVLSNRGGYNPPQAFTSNLPGSQAPKAVICEILPVWYSSQIPITTTLGTSGDTTTVFVGRREYVLLVERQGVEIAYSEHVGFATDQGAVRAIGRSAIAVTQPASLMIVTGVRK